MLVDVCVKEEARIDGVTGGRFVVTAGKLSKDEEGS